MAEKGFGVKEVNLIGASGTPTITSPNNLNLNANNVAISTNVSIGGTLSVTGNVSVGGTLTYEDVTNIDSVGVVTARDGVVVVGRGVSIVAGGLNVTAGISTLSGIVKIMSGLDIQTNGTLDIIGSSSSSGLDIQSNSSVQIGQNGFPNRDYATFTDTGVNLNYSGSTKLATTNTGVNVTGAITVNGSALSIDPTNSDVQVAYTVTANSNSAYRFAGNGVVSTADNPDLYLIRGQKYRFINNSGGNHPFRIQSDNSSTLYSTGVTNNNASTGNIDFAPTFDSPSHLYYKCGNHGAMLGNIYIVGQHLANGADNRVLTATSAYGMNAESGLTYNGQKLQVDTVTSESNAFRLYNTTTSATTYQINGEGDSFTGNVYPRSDGNLDLGFHSGYKWRDLVLNGGVRFGSANAQDYLDDYEEGSWTPQVKGTTGAGTASYSQQVGKYIIIGSWVYLTWVLAWSSGSAGGELRTTNLPFSPATDCTGMGSVMFNNISIHSNVSNIATYVGPGNDYCYFYTSRSSSGWITVNYSSSGNLIANVSFRTA